MKSNTKVATSIDAYLEEVPEIPRKTLQKIRRTIRAAAPNATELISYQIPTFKQEYSLIAFAAFKNHCSVFTMSDAVMATLAKDLEPYDCKGITIHFPLDKALPAPLLKKIVQLRLVEDATRALTRDSKKKKK
ncbi:MAG: hypothetical protein EOO13_07410 [Chitinophagaceae bacterium]|nr:MAG: hypothetical protein EOO13_07410 [Chitinophagaceae bacterium]